MTADATRFSIFIDAPRGAVYRALLDPRSIAAWKVPDGMSSRVHELDPREGGRFRVSLTYEQPTGTGKTSAETDTYQGHFEQLVSDQRVVEVIEFETDDPALRGVMRLTWEVTDEASGTRLVGVHENLPPGVSPAENAIGWQMALAKLKAHVERAAPLPEAWLRGPVPGVPVALQPVAHALLQALEDAERWTADLGADELWATPGGAASIGFHLRHMAGGLDRLLTYARGEELSEVQRAALEGEKKPTPVVGAGELLVALRRAVDAALAELRSAPDEGLDDPRTVGRARLPSTVRGLLHHAGEHTARHAGQISTTRRVVRGLRPKGEGSEPFPPKPRGAP